ncbi:MAG: hypothetical protein OXQ84_16495 [bacterium]|nr:hypothetical protein [bacterium]
MAMADLPGTAQVAFFSGGDAGASCLDYQARAGLTDRLLLKKNELTAGVTWHAAIHAPTFAAGWSIMDMQHYSAELDRRLAAVVDHR